MNDQIVCPNCKKTIPLTQALSHELNEKYQEQLEEEKNKLRVVMQQWQETQTKKMKEEQSKLEEEAQKKAHEIENTLKEKIAKEMELKIVNSKNENEELKKQNEQLQEQFLELNKLVRQLKTEKDQAKIDLEKRLAEEQEKIKEEAQKQFDEEYRLKIMEKDKRLQDALKMAEEYKRKLEQGSQQLQGEVLELEMENMLKHEFPFDEIQPVGKGMRGGDLIQIVKNSAGRTCGSILWESKRTKAWSNEWLTKLKEDQRNCKAELAILVSNILPGTVKRFGLVETIWVADYESIIGLAYALRAQLLEVSLLKSSLDGKQGKMEILYNYIYSIEFRHRIQAILETYTSLQEDLEKEKRWFAAKWAKQEKNLRRVIDNTIGMSGDVESITGKEVLEMQEVPALPVVENQVVEKYSTEKNTLF